MLAINRLITIFVYGNALPLTIHAPESHKCNCMTLKLAGIILRHDQQASTSAPHNKAANCSSRLTAGGWPYRSFADESPGSVFRRRHSAWSSGS